MMKYNSYRDSEIDWLGEENPIPKHWSVKRVKDLGNYQSGTFIDANEMDSENPYPVFGGNGIRGYAEKYNHNGEYILIGRQGALCGNINYAGGKFWATEHAVVVYKKKEYNLTWLAELFREMNFNQYSLSAAQPGLSVDRIKRLELPIPSFEEQTAIATYLNTKTQAIDKKVNLLEKKIGYYQDLRKSLINETVTKGLDKNVKLKDSGIDWIGQIPEHWEVKRVKALGCIETSSVNKKIEEDEALVKLVNYVDVFNNPTKEIWNSDNFMSVSANELQVRTKKLKYGDALFTPSSETIEDIGVSAIVMENLEDTLYSYHLIRLRFSVNFDVDFKKYMLNNSKVQYYFSHSSTGTTRKILGLNTIYNLPVVYPPSIKEQKIISGFLVDKTRIIYQIITNIQTQITTLKEIRKTLINDVVTGKIKVTP